MKEQKEDIINAFSTVFIVVLLLFVFSAWSDRPVKENESASAIELQLAFQIHHRNIIVETVVQRLFSPERMLIPFSAFESRKQLATSDYDNVSHCIFVHQNAQSPGIAENKCRFYYHLFPKDAEDLPDLS